MNRLAPSPANSSSHARIVRGRIRSPTTGHGSSANSNATRRCKPRRCLTSCVPGIPASIRPGSYAPCSATSNSGGRCRVRRRRSTSSRCIRRAEPGRLAQSDFTHMSGLGVTLGGLPFPHLVYHLVLTYSNVEAISVRFAEGFQALAEGLERCLWKLGCVTTQHRTDQPTADFHHLVAAGRHDL